MKRLKKLFLMFLGLLPVPHGLSMERKDNEERNELITAIKKLSVEDLDTQDENGETALIRACKRVCDVKLKVKTVRELLDKGADPNIQSIHGDTALIWACCYGDTELGRIDI